MILCTANTEFDYPVNAVIPELIEALSQRNSAVLSSPTGSGKSTVLPLALLEADFLAGKKILLLEPRRIATYAVAARLAENAGCELGETVGYRMRLERKVSSQTRLEVLTEGMLTRRLQQDPELSDVGLIIFDEFHERSLHADLGLALALDIQQSLREDLRILVMSATLDCQQISSVLGNAPVIESAGRSFPVDVKYFPSGDVRDLAAEMYGLIKKAIAEESGSLLCFLPGEGDIRQVENLLQSAYGDSPEIIIAPLYGRLDNSAQRRAILPPPEGMRKIVLATSIAESSLTIDGVRIVIDSGLKKVSQYSPESGLSHLETVQIAQSSAAQRAGRAGRTCPGTAWRMWSEQNQNKRPVSSPSEMIYGDLSFLALELAQWGVRDPGDLCWVEPPPAGAYQSAVKLLRRFQAVDENNVITQHGKKIAETSLGIRSGNMLIRALDLGMGQTACRLAGILEGFDGRKSDFTDIADALNRMDSDKRFFQARQLAENTARRLGNKLPARDSGNYSVGALLALAFPDRAGRRRGKLGDLNYVLSNGRGAEFFGPCDLMRQEFIVAMELDDRPGKAVIKLAAGVEKWELEELLADDFTSEVELNIDPETLSLEANELLKLGNIVWQQKRSPAPDKAQLAAAVGKLLRKRGLAILDWPPAAEHLQHRVAFVRKYAPDAGYPELSEEWILEHIEELLTGFLPDKFRKNLLNELDWYNMLWSQLDYDLQRKLGELAPASLKLSNNREFKVDYSVDPPALSSKLQHFFGVRVHPALLNKKVPLTVKLLSPAGRPVQVTNDLAGFWTGSYKLVRTEMRGRYPKHDWPEEP